MEFEHGQLSPWGYIMDVEKLPDFITTTDFYNHTNGKFGNDTRIATGFRRSAADHNNASPGRIHAVHQ